MVSHRVNNWGSMMGHWVGNDWGSMADHSRAQVGGKVSSVADNTSNTDGGMVGHIRDGGTSGSCHQGQGEEHLKNEGVAS